MSEDITFMFNLLSAAYAYIAAGDFQCAVDVLESLVNDDPGNVEAWEAYMQICGTCEELDDLCERVLTVAVIARTDRESILDYYYYLRQRLRSFDTAAELHKNISLEVVDQFNFTLRDQSLISKNRETQAAHMQEFIWILGKVLLLPYLVLTVLGVNLLLMGNDFGIWILIVMAMSMIVSAWSKNFPLVEIHRKESDTRAPYPCIMTDDISCHPELIR